MIDKFQILAEEINLQYTHAEDMARLTKLPEWEKVAEVMFELQSVAVDLMSGIEVETYKEMTE